MEPKDIFFLPGNIIKIKFLYRYHSQKKKKKKKKKRQQETFFRRYSIIIIIIIINNILIPFLIKQRIFKIYQFPHLALHLQNCPQNTWDLCIFQMSNIPLKIFFFFLFYLFCLLRFNLFTQQAFIHRHLPCQLMQKYE